MSDTTTAVEKLKTLARTARVTGDPSAPILEALAATLLAQQQIAESMHVTPVTDAQIDILSKRLATSVNAWSSHLVKSLNIRSAAIGLAALVFAAGIGAVGGWAVFAPTNCGDQADGSRVCWVYTRVAHGKN